MKRSSSQVLDSPFPDHLQDEKTVSEPPAQLPEVASLPINSRQEFAQLLAQYKRAVYEALEHRNQSRRC